MQTLFEYWQVGAARPADSQKSGGEGRAQNGERSEFMHLLKMHFITRRRQLILPTLSLGGAIPQATQSVENVHFNLVLILPGKFSLLAKRRGAR